MYYVQVLTFDAHELSLNLILNLSDFDTKVQATKYRHKFHSPFSLSHALSPYSPFCFQSSNEAVIVKKERSHRTSFHYVSSRPQSYCENLIRGSRFADKTPLNSLPPPSHDPQAIKPLCQCRCFYRRRTSPIGRFRWSIHRRLENPL